MCVGIWPRRRKQTFSIRAGAILAAGVWLASSTACRWDQEYDSPYLPGSGEYAGDEWTHDGDGDGIADSVQKYMPGCDLSPRTCLERARAMKDAPPDRYGLRAGDLLLWTDDGPKPPDLRWSPPEAARRGYALSSADTAIVAIRGGNLLPKAVGEVRVVVTTPGSDGVQAEFRVRVVARGTRVDDSTQPPPIADTGLIARPIQLVAGDPPALPLLFWEPPEAEAAGYRLRLDDTTSVVSLTEDRLKVIPLNPGTARVQAASPDDSLHADFLVTVIARRVSVAGLSADSLVVDLKAGPQSPRLHWEPANATDQDYALATRDSSVAVPYAGKIKPVGPGKTVFTATTHDGGFHAEFPVVVEDVPETVTAVSVADMSLLVGQVRTPLLSWMPAGAPEPAYALASEDTAIAVVAASDGGARIIGKRPGATRAVLRTANGLSASFRVAVASVPVALDSIQAPDFDMDLRDGPRAPTLVFFPPDATDQSIVLSAATASEAIRIEAGKVVPVHPGKAALRIVPGANPSAAVVCTVTVKAKVRSVTAKDDSLVPGGPIKAAGGNLTWDPPEATDKSYRLVSLDTGIVRIAPGDTAYRGVSPGTAKVVVRALDGSGAVDTFKVLVRIPITRIIAKDLTMRVGDPVLNPWFLFTFVPANASNQGWSFLYPEPDAAPSTQTVVSIVENWRLQAMGPGTASLIAYSLDNHAIRDTFTVTVIQPVQALEADTSEPITLQAGYADFSPSITVLPADATVKTWHLTSSNPAVASVAGGVRVHPIRAGTTLITAVSDDNPQITATFAVRVR
jgi:hypothetical protein